MNNTNVVCYCNSCFQNARLNARQEGRVEGAKRIISIIKKQQEVYRNNLKNGESKWLEGAVDCCDYLLQLIKESKGVN